MNKYYIRCIQADWPTLLHLGEKLGAIQLHYETDEENNTDEENIRIGEPVISATHGGAWDYIGPIFEPTGELDSEGNEVMTSIKDGQGNEYLHANLITPIALGETALNMQGTDEEVAEGLANLTKFFLLDEKGDARAPSNPVRVFAGMGA